MRPRALKKAAAALLSALLLSACATKKDTKIDRARVEARLQEYAELTLKMDLAGLAAMYAPDGELVNPSQPPIRGRAAIQKFLEGFSGFQVLSVADVPGSTLIDGDTSEQLGTYRQKVRSPEGRLFEVSGRLEIAWVKDPSGEWYISQLATFPGP
jgi:ketosteroid isomerase-like protein